jgi:hypothetical protein
VCVCVWVWVRAQGCHLVLAVTHCSENRIASGSLHGLPFWSGLGVAGFREGLVESDRCCQGELIMGHRMSGLVDPYNPHPLTDHDKTEIQRNCHRSENQLKTGRARESPLLTTRSTTSDMTRWCGCNRPTCGGVNLDELGGENRGVRIPNQLGILQSGTSAVVVEAFVRCCPL